MTENSMETVKGLNLKPAPKREQIQELLDRIVEYGFAKFTNKFCKNEERLKWGRLLAQCAKIQNEVLADSDLEELSRRLTELEKLIKR